jgi:hypothetical protein
MAKKDDNKTVVKKIEKPLTKLNALFNDLIDNISSSATNKRDRELERLSKEIDDIVFQEIKSLTKFTGDDISTFLVKLFNDYDNNVQTTIKSIEDIFSNDSSGIFAFFQERYKNQNLLFEDLNVICTQLYELEEAILATRDAIVTSDDMTNSVSRTLKFKNSSESDTNKQSYISIVENVEKQFKLLEKLKNHIIPNTLQYGRYYVYTVPYSKLFQDYYDKKVNSQKGIKSVTLESVDDEFVKSFKKEINLESAQSNVIKSSFNDILKHIEIYNDDVPLPVTEGVELGELLDVKKFTQKVEKATKNSEKTGTISPDATVDINSKDRDFSSVKDCYIKLIDPRKIIPVKILDETIGYYYIHEMDLNVSKSPFTTSIKINPNTNSKEVEVTFLSKITDKIVKAFDKKFLENNAKFKELILNALIYNDIYKKQLKFQFIPVDYITEFHVNMDEEGNGTSVIYPSLFYAKLYLALLIFKMITIISKSNDTRVHYVKQSGIDQDVANAIQSVARSIKERQINFTDLLNYNSMISKIGQNKDIFMPVGRSGDRGIEFDILAGQDVQMNTELMELLRTAFINATGVPSVIMNYINEADYAKTLVMANAKFLGRVVSYQLDFNPKITELYKKILSFTTDIPKETIEEFEFTLSTPKALNTMNMTDLITNADQVIMFMIKAMTGENSTPTDDDNKLKDILYKKFAKELLPMLPWTSAEKLYEEAQIELEKSKLNKGNEEES